MLLQSAVSPNISRYCNPEPSTVTPVDAEVAAALHHSCAAVILAGCLDIHALAHCPTQRVLPCRHDLAKAAAWDMQLPAAGMGQITFLGC